MSDIGLDSPQDGAEKKSVQICEDPNSKAHLEALFNVLNTGNSQEQPRSQGLWSGRKLPDSFFSPNKEKAGIRRLGPSISVGPSTGPNVQHNRSVSMPASFSDTHSRQFSLDSAVQGPIPPGWEIAHTPDGLAYYIDHNTRSTTWEDPRKMASRMGHGPVHPSHHLPMPPYPQQPHLTPQTHQRNTTPNQSVDSIPLPEGWQKAYTAEGEPYYVNHKNRTTSWFHPSMPQHHHSHSFAGISRGIPQGYQNYSSQQGMTLHQHLQVEKDVRRLPYDSHQQDHLMQQQPNVAEASHVPATLYNDPYLSSNNHIRQASHDSGLGVTAMPYQTETGMEFDDSMETGHSLSKASQNQDYFEDTLHPEQQQIPEQMEGDLLGGRWV